MSEPYFFLGIDPGYEGALAVLLDGAVKVYDAPVIRVAKPKGGFRTHFDTQTMSRLLRRFAFSSQHDFRVYVSIEKVGSMPEQGIVSAFNFGEGYGMWRGMMAAYEIPFTEVPPGQWKGEMMHGMGKEKGASIVRAKQLFPSVPLDRKKDHGRADALLLAEFGRREVTRG